MRLDSSKFSFFVCLALLLLTTACAQAQKVVNQPVNKESRIEKSPDFSRFFGNTTGAIVLYDVKNNRYLRHNEKRCATRYTPASTFKIPNALIALETSAVKDAETVMVWDKVKYPAQNWTEPSFVHWTQNHTLRSAMKYSVIWYFREIALDIGEERMKTHLAKFAYGNQDISGGLASKRMFEAFWLNNSLKISADEQIEFLRKFYDGKLSVSKRATDIVKQILVLEETPNYKLSGKTGGVGNLNGKALGWFVGYVETKDNTYFFALNIDGENYGAIRDRRIDLTKQILSELGFMKK
jgi:beta-lactamase class D